MQKLQEIFNLVLQLLMYTLTKYLNTASDFVNTGDMMELFLSFLHSNPNFGLSQLRMVYIVALIFPDN
jgi:hypothetical protein